MGKGYRGYSCTYREDTRRRPVIRSCPASTGGRDGATTGGGDLRRDGERGAVSSPPLWRLGDGHRATRLGAGPTFSPVLDNVVCRSRRESGPGHSTSFAASSKERDTLTFIFARLDCPAPTSKDSAVAVVTKISPLFQVGGAGADGIKLNEPTPFGWQTGIARSAGGWGGTGRSTELQTCHSCF